jgi:hypothetical protein
MHRVARSVPADRGRNRSSSLLSGMASAGHMGGAAALLTGERRVWGKQLGPLDRASTAEKLIEYRFSVVGRRSSDLEGRARIRFQVFFRPIRSESSILDPMVLRTCRFK